jgi:hypothetical protein
MENWIKEWLKQQRAAGEKCLEIKVIQNKPYVYHSTSRYDPVEKKPKKVSKYLGRLDKEFGIIRKEDRLPGKKVQIRSIFEYGNAAIIHEELKELEGTLKKAFPDIYAEIIAIVSARMGGYVPLRRVDAIWSKLYNMWGVKPDCEPKNLSKVLHKIGQNRSSQQKVFSYLATMSKQLIYDLSFIESYSTNISFNENAYVSEGVYHHHHHIALFCSCDSGIPVMIRSIPGSVNDVKTLELSLKEVDMDGKILLLDRGFISENNYEDLLSRKIQFIMPLKRDSIHYQTRIHLNSNFMFQSRLIHCGKRKINDYTLYQYEDEDLALEERKTLYKRFKRGDISRNELNERLKKAGLVLFLTTVDIPEQEVYELYKSRDMVEKHFDTFKNELHADKVYLRTNEALFGHIFTSFLSLFVYQKIVNRLKGANLIAHYSPHDVLTRFSAIYKCKVGERDELTEIPKRVRALAHDLNYHIFPN